ncbi:MAG: hypothetical protein AAGI08_12685 [Bacteroidota bacterium]
MRSPPPARRLLILLLACMGPVFSSCTTVKDRAEPRTGTLQFPRYALSSVTDGQWIYVFGGSHHPQPQSPERFPSALTATYERIDPETLQSSFYAVGLYRRANQASLVIDSAIASFGGRFQYGPDIQKAWQNEVLDISELTSREIAPLPEPLRTPGAAYHQGIVYLVGGATVDTMSETGQRFSERMYTLRSIDGDWERGPDLIHARADPVALVGDRIFAIGGYNGVEAIRSVQVYDTEAQTWSPMPDLPYPLSAYSLVVHGRYVFIFGDYRRMTDIHRYDTESGELTLLDTKLTTRRHSTAVKLNDRVFVIGGNRASPGLSLGLIEVFDLRDLLP